MKRLLFIINFFLFSGSTAVFSQELFVSTEPASNMPARSIAAKLNTEFVQPGSDNIQVRLSPEIQLGLHKNLMLHTATGFSDMYSSGLRWESVRLYAQYRFLSKDDVQKHFRMAAFAKAAYSRSNSPFDEINLGGDQSGIQGGIIATHLLHKLALSTTLSLLQSLDEKPEALIEAPSNSALGYTFSAGYLLLPRIYKNYKQTNFNIYAELTGQQSLDKKQSFIDLAPAVQFIFNSRSKLSIGYRFQLSGSMNRMAETAWMISFDTLFLNALKK